jgi:hypothetical protein
MRLRRSSRGAAPVPVTFFLLEQGAILFHNEPGHRPPIFDPGRPFVLCGSGRSGLPVYDFFGLSPFGPPDWLHSVKPPTR